MRVTADVVLVRPTDCRACWEDEHAASGAVCACATNDVPITVVANVTSDDGPDFHLLSIDGETGPWLRRDIEMLTREELDDVQEALWAAFLKESATPEGRVRAMADSLCKEINTHVEWSLVVRKDDGVAFEKLRRVRRALLTQGAL